MELTRTETIAGALREYEAFADLLDSLTEDDWLRPSRCTGWEVRDVAGHVVGAAHDVVAGVPGSRSPDEEAAALRHLSPTAMAAELRTVVEGFRPLAAGLDDDGAWGSPSGFGDLTIGEGVLTISYDTWMHADDIRAATDRPSDLGPGLRATLAYLEDQLAARSWGPAAVVFADQDESFGALAVGDVEAGVPTHRVPAYDFALAATGRIDPVPLGLDPTVNVYAD